MAKNLQDMTPDIRSANKLSIVDYARKNGFNILYEDYNVAITNNPHTQNRIRIEKENNVWFEEDSLGNEITHGNTVRFAIMKLNLLDKEFQEHDWEEVLESLLGDNTSYMDRESYNNGYIKSHEMTNVRLVPGGSMENTSQANQRTNDTVQAGDMEKRIQFEAYNNRQQVNALNVGIMSNGIERNVTSGEPNPAMGFPMGYSRRTFSKEQMAEILAGMKRGLNIAAYDNIFFHPDQMRQIRLAIQNSINPLFFNYPYVPADYMKEFRLAIKNGVDISLFEIRDNRIPFTAAQAKEIRRGLENGLNIDDVKSYARPYLDPDAMKELRLGLQDGFTRLKDLNAGNYSAKDIRTIRITLIIQKILDTIAVRFKNLFENILELFHKIIKENLHDTNRNNQAEIEDENIDNETLLKLKETSEQVYDSMEEMLDEMSFDKKTELFTDVFSQTLSNFSSMEMSVEDRPQDIFDKTIQDIMDAQADYALQQESLHNLKEEYINSFNDNETNFNFKMIEFTTTVLSDNSLSELQKVEILKETFGSNYGEKFAEKWIERATVQMKFNDLSHDIRTINEEYEQEFELER